MIQFSAGPSMPALFISHEVNTSGVVLIVEDRAKEVVILQLEISYGELLTWMNQVNQLAERQAKDLELLQQAPRSDESNQV
jgi:hypothetical protein